MTDYAFTYHHTKHPPCTTLYGNTYPYVVYNSRVHHEIGAFANMPAVKRFIRRAIQRVEAAETFISTIRVASSLTSSSSSQQQNAIRNTLLTLQWAREESCVGLNRFYLGGMTMNANLDKLKQRLRYSMHVIGSSLQSLLSTYTQLQFGVDENDIEMRDSIFDKTLMVNTEKEQLIVIAFNPFSHSITTNIRLAVAFPSFCLFDDIHKHVMQQIYYDFEHNVFLLAKISIPPLSSRLYYLDICRGRDLSRTEVTSLPTGKQHIVGNNRLSLKVNEKGVIEEIGYRGFVFPIRSEVGYYVGTSMRACRTGQ